MGTEPSEILSRQTVENALQRFRVIDATRVTWIEEQTDQISEMVSIPKEFILPGGSRAAAYTHLARAVCRRAERTVLELHAEEPLRSEVLAYLNRLSDWLFVAARTANRLAERKDVIWTSEEV